MNKIRFMEFSLLQLLENHIQRQEIIFENAISDEKRLIIKLR